MMITLSHVCEYLHRLNLRRFSIKTLMNIHCSFTNGINNYFHRDITCYSCNLCVPVLSRTCVIFSDYLCSRMTKFFSFFFFFCYTSFYIMNVFDYSNLFNWFNYWFCMNFQLVKITDN